MTVKSPRLAAFEALYKIQQESAYSNLSLDHLPVANGFGAGRIGKANHFGRFGG